MAKRPARCTELQPAAHVPLTVVPTLSAPTLQELVLGANVAVTVLAAFMDTVQVLAEPLHAPVQPVNDDPAVAVAVKVTPVFKAYCSVQSVPQLIPLGLLVTVPLPEPALVTVSV